MTGRKGESIMNTTIKVKFKHNTIRIYGDPLEIDNIWLASQKLRLQEVEPSFKIRMKNRVKRAWKFCSKFIKCFKFACSKDSASTMKYITRR